MNLTIMASGGGSNFEAILEKVLKNKISVNIKLLISNNSKCGAIEKAKKHNIETIHLAPSGFSDEKKYSDKLIKYLESYKTDMIILAGYMKKIPLPVVEKYKNKILNIHPALLPAFGGKGMYGKNVHKAVIEYGAKITGVTVHVVDEKYDHGPIVMQKTVDVQDNDTPDTLAERVLKVEHDTYWRAVKLFSENKIVIKNGRTFASE